MKKFAHRRWRPQLLLICALFWTLSLAGAPVQYSIIDLGTNYAFDINNRGQVVGEYTMGLGLGGSYWYGAAINESGQIVGQSFTFRNLQRHAVLNSNGVVTDLGTLSGPWSWANGINNLGQIVGESDTFDRSRAFLYENGVMHDLGTLGGLYNSTAWCINDSGQIVGEADAGAPSYSTNHAFLYSGGVMNDLGTLGGATSCAYGINNNGDVVGHADAIGNSPFHAFLYSGGVMKDLGTLGGTASSAWRINSKGQIVGWADTAENAAYHVFLYADGVMSDLNSLVSSNSGWTLEYPRGINDRGEIICDGENAARQMHGLLLRPTATLSISLASNQVTLSWPSNVFATFTLQTNATLLETNWRNASTAPALTNGIFQLTFPACSPSTFYRLKL
jgi:probable HAF family extracellular repeat protein